MILDPMLTVLHPLLMGLYRLRSVLASPMRANIIPNVVGSFLPGELAATTVSDLLQVVPIWVLILRGAHFTFIEPSLERGGYMATYCLFVSYLTASKSNSLFTWLLGIPYERLIWLHRFTSVAGVVLGAFHCYVAYVFGGDDDGDSDYSKAVAIGTPNLAKFLIDGMNNWSGTALLFAMAAMIFMSVFPFLRRHSFNIWYFLHVVFGITILVMLFLHSVPSASFVTAWWALDLIVRYGAMAGLKNVTRAKLRVIHQGGTVDQVVELIECLHQHQGRRRMW